MNRLTLLACAVLTIACGEKKAPASSGDSTVQDPSAEATSESGANLPQDKTSKAFIDALVDLEITRFDPTDGEVLKYDSLGFHADGTWSAKAAIEIADERMDCVESGSWIMDPATSPTQASFSWTVDKTSCAGREAGDVQRVLVELSGGTFDVSYR